MMSDESINFSSRNEGEERWEETAEHCRGSKHILEIYRLTLVSRPSLNDKAGRASLRRHVRRVGRTSLGRR